AAVGVHGTFTSVVGGEDPRQVVAEAFKEAAEVANTPIDVLHWVERVANTEDGRGLRHELHEPPRPRSRHSARIESRLDPNHRGDELLGDSVALGGSADHFGQRWCRNGLGDMEPSLGRARAGETRHPAILRIARRIREVHRAIGGDQLIRFSARRGSGSENGDGKNRDREGARHTPSYQPAADLFKAGLEKSAATGAYASAATLVPSATPSTSSIESTKWNVMI